METSDKICDLQQQQQQANGGASKQIVHVRGDSETELDLLFSVLNSSKVPTRSFRDMNLPLSFFKPPDPKPPGCHSRDGSLDGGAGVVSGHFATAGPGGLQQQSGMNVFHSRSHSSPAQLPLSLSVAPSPGHLKQGSVDGGSAGESTTIAGQQRQQQQNPWSAASNQQATNKFFLSNANGMWPSDTALKPGALPAQNVAVSSPNKPSNRATKVVQNGHPVAATQSLNTGLHNLGPLPPGWEQGVTPEGDIYYINHIEKTTSWFDPRIPKHMQKPVPVKASTAHSLQNRQQQSQPTPQQQQPHIVQQQQQQPAAQQHQGTPASQLRPPLGVSTQSVSRGVGLTHNEQAIRLELMKLQKEKERLRKEQEDAVRKEQALLKELSKLKTTHSTPSETNLASLMPPGGGGMLLQHQMVTSGVDPFLGQSAGAGADSHGRQSSGDSGLGNMGAANYALLRSTDEFLGNIDSMDIHDGSVLHKPQGVQQQQQTDLSQVQQCIPSMDMPLLGDSADQLGMDSDDLVSSLTDDLAMNMDDQMIENMIQYI